MFLTKSYQFFTVICIICITKKPHVFHYLKAFLRFEELKTFTLFSGHSSWMLKAFLNSLSNNCFSWSPIARISAFFWKRITMLVILFSKLHFSLIFIVPNHNNSPTDRDPVQILQYLRENHNIRWVLMSKHLAKVEKKTSILTGRDLPVNWQGEAKQKKRMQVWWRPHWLPMTRILVAHFYTKLCGIYCQTPGIHANSRSGTSSKCRRTEITAWGQNWQSCIFDWLNSPDLFPDLSSQFYPTPLFYWLMKTFPNRMDHSKHLMSCHHEGFTDRFLPGWMLHSWQKWVGHQKQTRQQFGTDPAGVCRPLCPATSES